MLKHNSDQKAILARLKFDSATHSRDNRLMRRLHVLLLCLISLLLAALACTAPTIQQTIIVTATPSPPPTHPFTPTATPFPTITPTPTPLPTATVVPQTAVDQANAALNNGDYQTAVKTYKAILDQPITSVDPQLRSAASFGAGVAALREGLFADAVSTLSDFISTYPSDNHFGQAYFLRGDAYLGVSQWQNAIADFQTYLKLRPGLLDSYAWERIGDANLALNQPADALKAYGAASQDNVRSLVPLLQIREKTAAAYLNAGNLSAAVAQYDAILKVAKVPEYRANIAYAAAQVLLKAGDATDTTAAYARLQSIVISYPQTFEAYQSMQALLQNGTPVDDYLRGQISFAAKDYNDTITALYNYTSHTPIPSIEPNAFMLLGQAYREVGNTAAALTSFQTVIDQYPKSTLYGDAWLQQGRTLLVAGKTQDAIAKYKELSEKHPGVPQGAEALWRAGYLYSTLGDTESSWATFEILGKKYPATDEAMDGLFRGGMAAYNAKSPARAQRMFAILASTGTGNLRAAGSLWLGRLYQLDKQDDLARTAYIDAAQADPGGYYSQRAADLLAGHAPFTPSTRYDWAFNDAAHIAEAEQWMRSTFKLTQTGTLWQLSPTLASDPRMLRGNELWAVAAYTEAEAEYSGLRDDNQGNPLALYQLATYFYQIGLYREAIATAAILLDGAKIDTMKAPRYIAALRYPIAYYDLVLPAAKKYGVDPLVVFSLIRQESLFTSFATSSAAAQGLMQIIPDTGAYIAGKLSWPDYQNSDVYRPYVNVAFGVWYLKEQLDTFSGSTYAALAAYNAGPDASGEWYRISNGDPDLFLQAIDYDQTQTYVRRIYEQYQVYTKIYGVP